MLWKILADAVMGLHLSLMGFFAVSAVLLALGFFRGHRNWQFFYYAMLGLVVGIRIVQWRILPTCSLTDWEYMLRRRYDLSESWMRTKSLLGTVILNTTGVDVPELAFTIMWVIIVVVMIGSLILRRG